MKRRVVAVGAGVLAFALMGCGAGGPHGSAATELTVDTVAGVERWLLPGSGRQALEVSVDTVTVIGGALIEDDAYQFDRVTLNGLASDAAGRLYLLDPLGSRVLVYDSLGAHVATHGRSGGGPGELGSPSSLAIGPGDSIWVADFGNRRYTVYPPDGGEPRSVGYPGDQVPDGPLSIDESGLLQILRPFLIGRSDGSAGDSETNPPRTILRLDAEGTVLDTLWVSRPPKVDEANSSGSSPGGTTRIAIRMPQAFEPSLTWRRFSDGGIVISDSAAYTLHLVDADGTVRRRIERDLPPRETTEADREFARERVRERMGRGGGLRVAIGGAAAGRDIAMPSMDQLLEAQLAAMTFAPVVPRITGIRVDPLDRIWVGVSLDEPETTGRVDLYDREGNLLGEWYGGELPDVFLGPSLAARIVRDELEVQQVVVYRIEVSDAR